MKKKEKAKSQSQLGLILFRFKKNKLAYISVYVLILIALAILLAPLYMDYDKAIKQNISERFISPCWEHPFGTDLYGRDLLARVIYGGRISLFAGLAVILFSFIFVHFLFSPVIRIHPCIPAFVRAPTENTAP